MAYIVKRGNLPLTPHTEFYAIPNVLSLEEIHGTYGFSGPHSRKQHLKSYPTEQCKPPCKGDYDFVLKSALEEILQPYHIVSADMPYEGDLLHARKPLLYGPSTIISISKPVKSMPQNTFFRNGEKHEIYYVQEGDGVLKTEYGNLSIRKGLYLIIPKGTTYQIELKSKNAFFLLMESSYPITFPPHYMNKAGQATLMAPIVETEIEVPEFQKPIDEVGEYLINVKHSGGCVTRLTLNHHPFDLVGWEGAVYPFGFDIKNHHGIAREIHTAPPVHQTFQSGNVPFNGFSLCSFVSQMEGWHPKDIAAPYAHSNVDSDEVMFFSSAEYGAREGVIKEGAITFHPGAIPHSPHGDAALRSIADRGKMNKRLAVMLDTYFESLKITEIGYKYRDKDYVLSWHKANKMASK
ncbi:MAG: homogentisate 1,2-dioxygenase [Candidatus Melainabacteria bacterium]|nr:homogentisate 1,2-dioxygenase [Candidatus Melainabacteria bacterium]